jgi:hypothetical protein
VTANENGSSKDDRFDNNWSTRNDGKYWRENKSEENLNNPIIGIATFAAVAFRVAAVMRHSQR